MSLNAAALRLLAEKGLSAADIVEVAEAMEVPPSADALRQARYRARRDVTAAAWESIRHQVFERDGHACVYCGATDDIACDHVLPLVQGGKSTPDNLVTACKPCNSAKGGRTPEEWLQ